MVNITFIELHLEEGSLSANLPFSGLSDSEPTDEAAEEADADEETATDENSGGNKGLALLGVFVFLVIATAVVKYLAGGDEEPEVAIETDEESPTVAAE